MPDFLIIGAQKSGTTSLYYYLSQHPCVLSAGQKEVHFFDDNFAKGLNWYRSQFPTILKKYCYQQIKKKNIITGEASPYYIFHPLAPKRISRILPEVRLIALLRNPIDRAYSQYHHNVRQGREPLSFEDAIAIEHERLQGKKEKMLEDQHYYSFSHKHCSYLSRGIYVEQLETWLSLFPKSQILIISSEDFYTNTPTIFKQILEFLNLPQWEPMLYRRYNPNKYSKMNAATRRYLVGYFRPKNEKLYQLLGVCFDWDR
ncbi:sulfotransferase domain-containing protein, partial [bacterium]|nr:sulfotransferase domain-containing protein [bacterium]